MTMNLYVPQKLLKIWRKRKKIQRKTRKVNTKTRCAVDKKTHNIPKTKNGQQSIRKASANLTPGATRTQTLTQ
jgi:hypothetical protein